MTALELDDLDPGEPPPLPDERGRGGISEELLGWLTQELKPPWWHRAAACRGSDSGLFFIERGQTAAAARSICAECPVAGVCLDWSLSEPESLEGIWGGMSRRERRAERKRRRLPAQVA